MNEFYIDAEFVKTTDPLLIEEIAAKVTHPGNMKKAEAIAKWEENDKPVAVEKALNNALFDAAFGEIVSISCALDDGEIFNVYRTDEITEKEMLVKFNEILSKLISKTHGKYESNKPITWVGHNIAQCDLRYLWLRMLVNEVKPSVRIPYDAKPWTNNVYDLRYHWCGGDMNRRSSMDFIMKCLGMGGKGDFTGEDVGPAWEAGEYKKISDYNIQEIDDLRSIYKKMKFI